jgi:hypothetical protein
MFCSHCSDSDSNTDGHHDDAPQASRQAQPSHYINVTACLLFIELHSMMSVSLRFDIDVVVCAKISKKPAGFPFLELADDVGTCHGAPSL